ncbi:DUF1203 domain-containing protein [Micromonospora sp. CA-248089]|uniref:DUF1203 domain-containing protein n=1 Tax=Micromonospora sp. CA-248089 TaxID=3239960 RepID=UPI003D8A7805
MTTTRTAFRIRPLTAGTLAELRRTGRDAGGRPPEHRRATGGEPLRCCLRDARPDEALLLFGYAPPLPPGPYREVGPVFAHAAACAGPDDVTAYPSPWRGREQVLRAYDSKGRIVGGRRHDGGDPEAVIAELFADPAVELLHSRNVVYGCWMFAVVRS